MARNEETKPNQDVAEEEHTEETPPSSTEESTGNDLPSDALVTTDENLPGPTLEEMGNHLVKVHHEKVNGGKIDIGEYLMVHLLKNDLSKVSSRNPNKEISFEDLAKNPDLEMSADELRTCVKVAALERVFKEKAPDCIDLAFGVKKMITRIKDEAKRLSFAKKAYRHSYTVEDTRVKVQELNGTATAKKSDVEKILTGLKNPQKLYADKALVTLCKDDSWLTRDPSSEQRRKMMEAIKDHLPTYQGAADLLKSMEERLKGIDAH